jgi:hypothetical protein
MNSYQVMWNDSVGDLIYFLLAIETFCKEREADQDFENIRTSSPTTNYTVDWVCVLVGIQKLNRLTTKLFTITILIVTVSHDEQINCFSLHSLSLFVFLN